MILITEALLAGLAIAILIITARPFYKRPRAER
jgi:hypothetical protein